MASQICVDASLVLKLVLREPDSPLAEALWTEWLASGVQICAPTLLEFETASVLRNKVYRGRITPEQGEEAFHTIRALDITILHPGGLLDMAWGLAKRFNRPVAYDSTYLALAQFLDCELWTADERLYNAVKGELSWVRRLGNAGPSHSRHGGSHLLWPVS